jgi:hypothetical protein
MLYLPRLRMNKGHWCGAAVDRIGRPMNPAMTCHQIQPIIPLSLRVSTKTTFATIKDDLTLLASTDPLFEPELEKYIGAKKAERAVRVEIWLQGVKVINKAS